MQDVKGLLTELRESVANTKDGDMSLALTRSEWLILLDYVDAMEAKVARYEEALKALDKVCSFAHPVHLGDKWTFDVVTDINVAFEIARRALEEKGSV